MRRPLLALYALILFGEIAWQSLVPLTPDLKESLGLDATRTGMLLAATPLAIVAVSLPAGLATDRLGAAWLTVAAAMLCGAACVAQGTLAHSFAALIACRIVFGLGFAFIWTSGISWLTEAAGVEHRTRTLSITIALAGISSFVGPGFAGLLAERTGPGLPFTLTGIALVVPALFLVAPAHRDTRTTLASVPLRDWIGRTLSSRVAVAGLVTMTAGGLAMSAINLLVPLDLDARGMGPAGIGAVYAVSACFFTVTSVVGARMGNRIASPALGGATLLGLSALTVLPFLRDDAASIITFVLARAPFTALLFASAFAVGLVGADEVAVGRGAMMGLLNLVWAAASFAGPPLAGALRDGAGRGTAWIVLTVMMAASAPVGLRATRRRRGTSDAVMAPPPV